MNTEQSRIFEAKKEYLRRIKELDAEYERQRLELEPLRLRCIQRPTLSLVKDSENE